MGALGTVSDMFEKYAGKLNFTIRLEVIAEERGSVGNSWTITNVKFWLFRDSNKRNSLGV